MTLFVAYALVVRNLEVSDAFVMRRKVDERRRAAGLAPRARRRRRTTLANLAAVSPGASP